MPRPGLIKPLQRQLKKLVDDLRDQSTAVPELDSWLRAQYAAAKDHRTGATFEEWREEQLDQAAVAWLLGTVFVRFCEDNDLISGAWIAGPGGRAEAAAQAQTAYFMKEPLHSDRHWILAAFTHLRGINATAGIFDDHNPVWRFPISGDAASALLDFWRRGDGADSFMDPALDTRFLGDLYQDLSEYARKRYALLQTPEFVEEFILDLTLTPSIDEYGLAETSVIDPTCGSGHFLLGAFERLNKLWEAKEPATNPRVRVQKALDQVTGVDINPFAVMIAKFRLMVAALRACGERSLEHAPGFKLRLAAGDSLLPWDRGSLAHQGDLMALAEGRDEFAYFTEDAALLADYLRPSQYTVVVGNPPYITVRDGILNRRYRDLYPSCSRQYALSVPFVERFFRLAIWQDDSGRAGFVGQITANSFMKREFGKKLVEEYLAGRVESVMRIVELTHVIDTSGAHIPGHGTPTVILIGRRRYPRRRTIRAVLGILGEPSIPRDPSKGVVWAAISGSIDRPGVIDPYVTVSDLPKENFKRHPWSLSGGGAGDLKATIEVAAARRMRDIVVDSGNMLNTREDDAFVLPLRFSRQGLVPSSSLRLMGEGTTIRDWTAEPRANAIFPYASEAGGRELGQAESWLLWPNRKLLQIRRSLSGTQEDRGIPWWEYSNFSPRRYLADRLLVFTLVATLPHFVIRRFSDHNIFSQAATVLRLSEGAGDNEYFELLGLLNSSTACFWLKQVSQPKAGGGVNRGMQDESWEERYEFTGTKLQEFPVPAGAPLERARRLDGLAQELSAVRPKAVAEAGTPTRDALNAAQAEYDRIRGEMIAVQEELDWEVYRLYKLLDEDLTAPEACVPRLNLGERAFEIVLARKVAAGDATTEWFKRHGSTPITEIPAHWPAAYQEVVERRIRIIEERSDIALIERPECKRRWAATPWETQEKAALKDWLLDRLEAEHLWRDAGRARVLSVAQLATRVGVDPDFRSVLALYHGRDDYDLAAELTKLVADEAVPYLAAYRYKPSGLRKRAQWERTWELQRKEDAGEKVGDIPVPPKYASADFAKVSYWRNRGKLDVPKERFVAYPKAGRDTDRTPVIGWAGWHHLDQAQALATLYLNRKNDDGWPRERLLPLLAGLAELEPWLHQWYADNDPNYAGSPAAFYTNLLNTELSALGCGRADLAPEKLP